MGAKVISKLRCYSPNLKDTPTGNVKHLYYISDRTNAMKNIYNNSIFGYINYKNLSDNVEKIDIAKYIRDLSMKKTNVYRGIISLKEQDAVKLGYTERRQWEYLLKNSIKDIGNIMNIPSSNLEYIAVVHYKKGNPHIHYMFWDKNQSVNSCFITENQQNKIRNIVTKRVYEEELKELYVEKDNLKKDISSMELINYIKSTNIDFCDEKIPYQKMNKKNKKEIVKMFKDICKQLPSTGSLKYAYMPKNIKNDLNKLIDKLKESNFDLNESVENYIEKTQQIANYFTGVYKDNILSSETDKIYKMLGNKLLKLMKEYKEISAETILYNLYSIMSRLEDQQAARESSKEYINSLSENAKKEYARIVNYSSEELEM